MYKILLILTLGMLLYTRSEAQTTQYRDSVPCPARPYYGPDWDWRAPTFTMYMTRFYPNAFTLESPFHAENTTRDNENISFFSSPYGKDYDPKDGWEFIQKDFGENNRFVTHPYFILYNKYRGLMRIFAAIGEVHAGYNRAVFKR
jgi:hypothetical protein